MLKRVHMPCVARLQKVGLADRSAVSSSHGLSNLGVLQIVSICEWVPGTGRGGAAGAGEKEATQT